MNKETRNILLKSLDRLVGSWETSDPSGADAVKGQSTFEWMEGGNFLVQHINLSEAKGIEIIGYDEKSNSLKSHYFEGSTGKHLEYTYQLEDDTLTVSIDMPTAKGQFIGKFNDDNSEYKGRWDWMQDGKKMGFEAKMNKIK
ncbi:MAG: hypothetical protein H7Y03_13245 [Chitinophagaceae bacterium]|nr:hypothetical protein [Chitinophagaceae bacterium]